MKHRQYHTKKNRNNTGWAGRTGLILLALLVLLQPVLTYSGLAADVSSQLEESGVDAAIVPEDSEADIPSSEESSVEPTEDVPKPADSVPGSADDTPEPTDDVPTPTETPTQESVAPNGNAETQPDTGTEMVQVRIHDMDWDGTEILDSEQKCLTLELASGTDLLYVFQSQGTLIGTGEMQKKASELLYYWQDGSGQKQRYRDLSQPVLEDLDLYTYRYRLSIYGAEALLAITPDEDSASEKSDTALLTLTVREGQPVAESALTAGGTDLAQLSWMDQSNGEALDPMALMASGLTANLNVTVADTSDAEIEDRAATGTDSAQVYCYVAIDGEWKQAAQLTTTMRPDWWRTSNGYRYTVSANELYDVYKDYGLTQADLADLNGKLIFPHTDSYDPSHIWADTPAKQVDGAWWIPVSARSTSYIYYMPNNRVGSESYFSNFCDTMDSVKITANGFFHLDVLDPQQLLGSDVTLPEEQLIAPGSGAEVTLPVSDAVEWLVRNKTTNARLDKDVDYTVTESDGKLTFHFDSLSCPIRIVATPTGDALYSVEYRADVTPSLTKLGQFEAGVQKIIQNGAVYGQVTYTMPKIDLSESYRILSPDNDYAELYYSGTDPKQRRVYYTFQGWRVGNSDTILQPGIYTGSQIEQYMGEDNILELNAVWAGKDGGTCDRVATVNFFVNLACEIMDNTGNGYQPNPGSAFGGSVYATRIYGGEKVPYSTMQNKLDIQIIAPPEGADTAYDVDAKLRAAVDTPVSDEAGTYSLQMESFPSDEYVFNELRSAGTVISLDGKEIPTEQLNTDNFQIRWYVLKYEHSDGWHVDGILVAKEAQLVIRKTFAGDAAAMEEIKKQKEPFYLAVNHLGDNEEVEDYHLTLDARDEVNNVTDVGYTEYDAATHTYTWVLGVRQGRTYTVQECNYTLDATQWNHTNRYRIRNAPGETTAEEAWKNYDSHSEVKVVAEAYAADLPEASYQTVEFENLYVKAGLLTVHKVDSVTNNGLKNVSFRLSLENGNPLKLYQMPGTSYYSTDNNAVDDGYTVPAPDNTITTDANGYFYVRLGIFGEAATSESYILEEKIPTGYEGAKKIRIEVTDNGTIRMAEEVLESTVDGNNEWIQGEGTTTLTLLNRSKLLTEVKAEKKWEETPEERKLPVTVELLCNGIRLRGDYVQELSADNNWTYSWENLPLFVDGGMAQYTIREIAIGEEDYDAAEPGGYADYLVEYDAARYKEGTEGDYNRLNGYWKAEDGTLHYADHALLVVHNSENTGKIAFDKVGDSGEGLADALFGLYADRACTKRLDSAVSSAGGFVEFPVQTKGTYYVKEITAPPGYALDDMVYTVVVKSGQASMTDDNGDPVETVVNHTAVALTLRKTDAAGNLLSGAVFTVYRQEADGSKTTYGTYTTGQDGSVATRRLEQGTYRIEETTAPPGFRPRTDSFRIDVANGGITADPTSTDLTEWTFAAEEEHAYSLTVMNHAMYQLPNAGGRGIGWPTAMGVLLMCGAAAGYLLWLRRRGRTQGM